MVSCLLQGPWPHSMYEIDPSEEDWDKGLPDDVLALVAKAGGVNEMKSMRQVSKTWQLGFELGVQGITILEVHPMLPPGMQHPMLPQGMEAAGRFPALTKLDLGRSAAVAALPWLINLRAFPNLDTLILGERTSCQGVWPCNRNLPRWLKDDGMAVLQARTSEPHYFLSYSMWPTDVQAQAWTEVQKS